MTPEIALRILTPLNRPVAPVVGTPRHPIQPVVKPPFSALVPISENILYRIEKNTFYQDSLSITVQKGASKTVYRMDLRSGTVFQSTDSDEIFSIILHEPGPDNLAWDTAVNRMIELLDEAASRAVSEETSSDILRLKAYLK